MEWRKEKSNCSFFDTLTLLGVLITRRWQSKIHGEVTSALVIKYLDFNLLSQPDFFHSVHHSIPDHVGAYYVLPSYATSG